MQQVLGLHQIHHRGIVADIDAQAQLLGAAAEAQYLPADPPPHDAIQADKGTAADEQNLRRIHLQVVLLRVLAAALRGYVGHRTLEDLQQCLLHALAGDIARDRDVLRPPGDLVDLVHVDDADLRAGNVEVGRLHQAQDDVLHVLAHVARLGQGGGVRHGERHVQATRQGAGQQGLARAGRPHQQHVALLDLDLVQGFLNAPVLQPLVVVVHRDGKDALDPLLTDDVLVEKGLQRFGFGHLEIGDHRLDGPVELVVGFGRGTAPPPAPGLAAALIGKELIADGHTLGADRRAVRTGNHLRDVRPAATAEGARLRVVAVLGLHDLYPRQRPAGAALCGFVPAHHGRPGAVSVAYLAGAGLALGVRTSSTRP